MKKLLITSVLAISVSVGLYSCNNGVYDADPSTDYSAVQNPINPTSGTTVYIGSMKAMINGVEVVFSPVYHVTDTFNIRTMYAFGKEDSIYYRTLTITFPDGSYKGPGTYNIGDNGVNISFEYKEYDPDEKFNRLFNAGGPNGGGNKVTLEIKGDEGGHMRGTISGQLLKSFPFTGPMATRKFSNTEFYSEKKAFPLK